MGKYHLYENSFISKPFLKNNGFLKWSLDNTDTSCKKTKIYKTAEKRWKNGSEAFI